MTLQGHVKNGYHFQRSPPGQSITQTPTRTNLLVMTPWPYTSKSTNYR